ncbi:MAG: methyltransferase domain-containing protein [Hyphomonadaceae bacterium]
MATGQDGLKTSVAGKGVYPAAQAKWLLHPLRRSIMSPKRIVGRLALKPTDSVLEIGPGPGWFSPEIARLVPQGRLVLFDVQREMLALAEQRLKQSGHANAEFVSGDAIDLPFDRAEFDAVLLVTVLGEIGDPGRALREIARVLRPGGRIVITEQLGDPDHVRRDALAAMAAAAGLRIARMEGSLLLYSATLVSV